MTPSAKSPYVQLIIQKILFCYKSTRYKVVVTCFWELYLFSQIHHKHLFQNLTYIQNPGMMPFVIHFRLKCKHLQNFDRPSNHFVSTSKKLIQNDTVQKLYWGLKIFEPQKIFFPKNFDFLKFLRKNQKNKTLGYGR